MKKKIIRFVSAVVLLFLVTTFTSCVRHCTSSKPYYCSTYNTCCPYPYYAVGSGYCYETSYGCESSGYYCVKCPHE